jgi:NAD(P)-dependent dehydrogenase (short-subunit alcohol dehydrogenase family)
MESLSGKIALVTGASSGIGAAICREFASHGMIVIGAARREDRLKVTDFSSLSHLQFYFLLILGLATSGSGGRSHRNSQGTLPRHPMRPDRRFSDPQSFFSN